MDRSSPEEYSAPSNRKAAHGKGHVAGQALDAAMGASSHCSSAAPSCCFRMLGICPLRWRYKTRHNRKHRGLGCSWLPPWSAIAARHGRL